MKLASLLALAVLLSPGAPSASYAISLAAPQQSSAPASAKHIGTIKSINNGEITFASDSGAELQVVLAPNARILRIAPGEKNLKNATPAQASELAVGDRILVAGPTSPDGKGIMATTLVLVKQSDVASRNKEELQQWQRGVGGVVKAVDSTAKTISISSGGFGRSRNITVHLSPTTIIRRYAPGSTKFEDAVPGTLQQIEPGDQLRARGQRNPEGNELTADEIVSGKFSNVAGLVLATDAAANTITVKDLIGKKTVTLRISPDSQLRALPPEAAQRMAMRMKAAGSTESGKGNSAPTQESPAMQHEGPAGASAGANGKRFGGGSGDLQQALNRMPETSVSQLKKGDAVLVVATESASAQPQTVITLVSGVEPILEAAPRGSQSMVLTPWTLGGGNAEGADQ